MTVTATQLANLRPPIRRGEVRNPGGRTGGAVLREILNAMFRRRYTLRKLRRIRDGEGRSFGMRAVASRCIVLATHTDMAMFGKLMRGEETIEAARDRGVPTELIKKVKARNTKEKYGDEWVDVTTIELELWDRSGEEFDRICDRTEGKPTQRVEFAGNLPSMVQIVTPMSLPVPAPPPRPLPGPDGHAPRLTGPGGAGTGQEQDGAGG